MKKKLLYLFSFLLPVFCGLFLLTHSFIGTAKAQTDQDLIPDQYIVLLNDDVADPAQVANETEKNQQISVKKVFKNKVKGFVANKFTAEKVNNLKQDKRVKLISQDRVVRVIATGDGLKADYFDNKDFTGSKISRIDPTVNFNWGSSSPNPQIAADTFSARWTGQILAPKTESYTFYTKTDDGVRLWVNNKLLIDKWVNQGGTEWKGTISLTAGQKYDIKMEYFENTSNALAQLSWSTPTISKRIIPQANLFSTVTVSPTPTPTPTPVLIKKPDLIVTQISSNPPSPAEGDNVIFSATVKNQGTAATSPGVIIGVLFRVDGQPVTWSDTYTTALTPGSSITLTTNGGPSGSASWKAIAGAHSVLAEVDDINRMAETNETNNTLEKLLNVELPVNNFIYLSDLGYQEIANGWGSVEKDKSNGEELLGDGNTLTLNGKTYQKGLGAHAYSEIKYQLSGNCSNFRAEVGIDDEMDPYNYASAGFEVYGDNVKLFDSGVMRVDTPTKLINVDVSGKQELKMVINDAGDNVYADHGDWADAKLVCSGGANSQVVSTGVQRVGQNLTNRGAGVTVAVIDTGIELNHPDLKDNIVASYNCMDTSLPGNDKNGHGTHVAGVIGALDNNFGSIGVAPGAKLVAVKVFDDQGLGTWSSVICGIDWVTTNAAAYNIKVVNMSLAGDGVSDNNCGLTNNDAVHQAICMSTAGGLIYVAGAGNNAGSALNQIPAAYNDTVITVSALADYDGLKGGLSSESISGADDTFASFSNYGSNVDLGAPGVNIYSTYLNGGYINMSGTSVATPFVSGAAALYLKSHPGALWTEVRDFLSNNGEALGNGHTDPSGLHPEPVVLTGQL